jgi:predicted  nucleic acid-binding Zn-ribbon protein
MTDETPTQNADQADKEWADLQRDLDTLGEQLGSLRDHSAALGDTLVNELETRFQDVRSRTLNFRNATEAQFEALRQLAAQQASATQSSLTEASLKSAETAKETARQVWERSEPLRLGAQEVGQGFVRAWSEIASSFGKAAEKIQTETSQKSADTGEESKSS